VELTLEHLWLAIHFTASQPAPHLRQATGSDALPRMRGQRRVDPALRPLQRPQRALALVRSGASRAVNSAFDRAGGEGWRRSQAGQGVWQ